jgi:hypothetical protein
MRWGEAFLERFDFNVRGCGVVRNPSDGAEFKVSPKAPAQSFRRNFGEVVMFSLSSGLISKSRLHLAAVRLQDAGDRDKQAGSDLLKRVAGPDGLDFQDGSFYCVGLFAPSGWSGEWRANAAMRGNALFFLVEKGEGTAWRLSGPDDPVGRLFDPETAEEKSARAVKALAAHPRLVLPGDQIEAAAFAAEQGLAAEDVAQAIAASDGRFQSMDYKGRTYIQRSTR